MQRRVVIEDRREGREDGARRRGGELGRAARLTEKERFVEDAGGDVNRCLSCCMREGPAVIDDESRRIAYGAKIPLDALARFEFTCPACKKVSYGRTNIEDAEITNQKFSCVCGRSIPKLTWNPAKRCYTA